MIRLNNLDLLAEKLNKVSDTYENFVSCIVFDCEYYKGKNPNVAEQILEYIEKHPDANSSDILDFEMTAIGIPYCDDNGVWYRWDKVISESEAKRISQEEYCDD